MGNCCSTDGVPGGGDYRPRRTAAYEVSSEVSSLNSQQLKQFDRLSRPETIKGVYGQESSPFAESLARKMKLLKASITDGINEDPDQFQSEIKESIPELRHFERRRIREWIDLVIEMNKEHVARRVAEELNKAASDLNDNNNNSDTYNNLNKNHQRSTSSISDLNNNNTSNTSKNTSGTSNFHFRQASDTSIFSLTTKSNANSGSLQGSNKLGLIPIVHRNSPQQIHHRRNGSGISDNNKNDDDDDDDDDDVPGNGCINQTLEGKDDCASKTATHHSAADAGSLDNDEGARTNSYNSSGAGPSRKNNNKTRMTVEAPGDYENNDDDDNGDDQKQKLRIVASSTEDLQDASTSSARQNGSLTPSAAATKNDNDNNNNNGFSTTHHHTESKANHKPGKSLAVTPTRTTPGEVSSTSIETNNKNSTEDENSPTNEEISGGAANKNNNSNRTPATTDFTPIVTVVDCKASPITTVTIKRQLLPTDPEVVKIVSKMTKHQRLAKMFYPIPKKMKKRATSPKDAALPAWLTP